MFFLGEAPPPGSYDPKFESKVKGIVLEKKERFPDNKSVCSNKSTESHVSTASKASSSHLANKVYKDYIKTFCYLRNKKKKKLV